MTAITISTNLQAALEVARDIRNGLAPTTDLQNRLATLAGYAAYADSKLIFRSAGQLCSAGSSLVLDSLATRPRWRFPLHTGPYAWYLMARMEIAPQNNGTATDPYCELRIYNTSGTQVGVCSIHGGSSDGSYADVPINMTGGVGLILDPNDLTAIAPLDPDTEYTGVFWDIGYARLQSAAVWEVSLNPDTDNGYARNNLGAGSPIYSSHRNDVAAMARLLHKRSGTPVFHWCSNVDSAAPVQASEASAAAAAMTLGAVTVSSTGTVGGTGVADMTLGAVTISATATIAEFEAVLSTDSPHLYSLAQTVTITATASGAAQTNASIFVQIYDNYFPSTVISAISTTVADGWSETGWFNNAGVWQNTYTRASVSVGSTTPQFQITYANSGDVYMSTALSSQPHTDQATGDGNNVVVDVIG